MFFLTNGFSESYLFTGKGKKNLSYSVSLIYCCLIINCRTSWLSLFTSLYSALISSSQNMICILYPSLFPRYSSIFVFLPKSYLLSFHLTWVRSFLDVSHSIRSLWFFFSLYIFYLPTSTYLVLTHYYSHTLSIYLIFSIPL